MNNTTLYRIQVDGSATTTVFVGYFLQFPTSGELAEAIDDAARTAIADGNAAAHSGDGIDADTFYDDSRGFEALAKVARIAELPVPPITGLNQVIVNYAGVKVGRITADAIPARTRNAAPELCAA